MERILDLHGLQLRSHQHQYAKHYYAHSMAEIKLKQLMKDIENLPAYTEKKKRNASEHQRSQRNITQHTD